MLIHEIVSLSSPQDMPRKIVIIQHALSLVQRQSNPKLWAALQTELGNSLYQNPEGNQDNNIEKAIEHYNQALEVRTYKNFPMDWALTLNNLATAYIHRIRGDRAENIEQAIKYYNQALKVRTHKDFPVDWAITLNNLASAYGNRILGDKVENIEQAIECCNQALQVRTQKDFPVDWAGTQNNLGNAYSDRILGDRAANIEQAIKYYNQALKVRTHKDSPVDWAGTQNNLALAYWSRIRGDRAENIEQAIEHYNQALKVRTYKNFPMDWAMTQNNLALAYWSRILGDKAENIEQAIEYYNQALKVRTQKDFPVDWAITQNNLANAYLDRIRGIRAENIEQAIEYYNHAFEVFTYHDSPVDWAGTQNNLASAFWRRVRGDKAKNIEQAIEYYNKALQVRTQKDFPVDWAGTQSNLAAAYWSRIRGNRADNIEQAISHCYSALEIYKLESMPENFRNTCGLLGDLYLEIGQWKDALESYRKAIKAGDLLYRSGLSEESKSIKIGENANFYRNAIFVACHLDLTSEALIIFEEGKTRLLSEALRLKMKQPKGIHNDEWKNYEQAAERYRSTTKAYIFKENCDQKEKQVKKALEELDIAVKLIRKYDPNFYKELDISDILSIPDSETALLTFCITNKGSIGFVASRSSGIQRVDIPDFKTGDLKDLLFKTNEEGFITGGWIGEYLSYLNTSSTGGCEDVFLTWKKTFHEILSTIGTMLLSPLLAELPSQTKRLILLPSDGLFLLPLHATPLSNGQLLCQRYCISYAPSIRLLKEMQSKAKTIKGEGLYAVINPDEDPALVFSGCEGRVISKLFQSPQISVGETGTRETVLDRIPGRAYLHFSCHGSYNWNNPLLSELYLVGGRTLSLGDLQSDIVDMASARLVTLSACETGITDIIRGSADEFVGLPAGFMLAGVPCVISSLWSVPDISTALLMERFYSNHIKRKMDISMALQEAQLWVRDLTAKQIADYVEKCYQLGKWEGKSKEFIEHYREHYLKLAEESPDEKPFQHPYYWAAFTVNGA